MVDFRILGPFEVVRDGRPVALGGAQQRALLALLVLHRGKVLSTDRLVDELWAERAPATGHKTVQVYVWNLRRVLGEGVIVTRGRGYVLAAEAGQVDVEEFEAMVGEGRRALDDGNPAQASARLGEALALWRGETLADLAYEPFAQREIALLEDARLAALEDRIEADLALGRHAALVGELESLVASNPLRERPCAQLMLALYRSGRQADALECYREARRELVDELGIEPGPTLQELERGILAHDPALDPPPDRSTAPRKGVRTASRRGRRLVVAGAGVLLAAAIAAAAVALSASGGGFRLEPNSVVAIDPRSDSLVGEVPVGTRPAGIAFGSGSLWVANLDDQTITRIDPATLQPLRTLAVGDPPTAIAGAGAGVWFVGSSPTATFVSVSHVDPQFDVIDRTVRIGNVVPGSPGAMAAEGAALWVAPFSGELTRVDSRTGGIAQQQDPNTAPTGIAVAAGAVWLTASNANNVTRVDRTGLVTSLAVGHAPSGIAVGEGGVWVADTGDNAIVRIDPSTGAVTTTVPVGHAPTGVAIGAGSVWVANSGDGTVTRIDPGLERPTATIAVGGSPQAIAVAAGRVWVTVDARTIPAGGPGAGGGTARIEAPSDVTSMDPALANDPVATQLLYATCAKLLTYPDRAGQAGSQLVPDVAQALPTRSPDGKSYTFTIRGGFRFSPPSNEPVTAQTFKYSIERSLNPRMRSPSASEFGDIVGARAYMAGESAHIAGVIARGNTLTIHLIAPAADLPARTTEPVFCAVPSDTPPDPRGVRVIPSAGPYRVASYTPGQGVVLTRNPNYQGSRPHRLARIELAVGIPAQPAIADIEAGTADYAVQSAVDSAQAATLAARYGPGSAAAKSGHQQFFVNPRPQLDFLALNTHRPLFADLRLRQAINYAIDRTALARLGDEYTPLPEHPTDHYLPPGIPGYGEDHIYPLTPDLTKARQLANGHAGTTAVLYTCDVSPCDQQAQIIKTNLAAIGLSLKVKAFPDSILFTKTATPGEPFDIAWIGWIPDYLDPNAMLNVLLADGTVIPTFQDPTYRARLAAAARLTGPQRYLTYARLDADLARNAAPLAAFGNLSSYDFFSARMGCELFGPYGIDLAALCIKKTHA